MHEPAPASPRAGAAILVAAIALYLLLASAMAPFTPDDAYISFRYAGHLAAGSGFTFNPGEAPVEGYSNFLWILVCAAFAAAGLDLVEWSRSAGLLLGAGTLGVAWAMLAHRGATRGHLAIALFALASAGPFVLYSISGLETALFGLLLMLALLCAERAAASGSGWLGGLAASGVLLALCRPEGVLVFPVLFAFLLGSGRLRGRPAAALAAVFGFAVAVGVYQVWRLGYFGEAMPTPFHSKGAAGALIEAWKTNLRYLFVRQNHYFAPIGWYLAGFAGIALLGEVARFARERRAGPALPPLLLALALAAVYMNFVDWMPGMRYFAPLIAPVMVSLPRLDVRLAAPAATARGAGLAAALIVVLAAGFGSVAVLRQDARRNEASTRGSQVALGKWLAANVREDAVLAVSDVGAIPFHSRLRTIDIHPRSLTDVHIATHGWSDGYVLERDPDVVVLVSFSLSEPAFYGEHRALHARPEFRERWRLVGVTRYDWHMDRCYWVFAGPRVHLTESQIADLPEGVGAHPSGPEDARGGAARPASADGTAFAHVVVWRPGGL